MNHILQSTYSELHTTDFSAENHFRILLMNVAIVAVNCFIFISGFFKIQLRVSGVVKLWSCCFFYTLLSSLLLMFYDGSSYINCITSIFSLSESHLWFIRSYVGLMFLSPLINLGLINLDNKQRNLILFSIIIVDLYFGYIHQISEISIDGYNLLHMICMYVIGALLRDVKQINGRICGFAFLACVIAMTALHSLKMLYPQTAIIYSLRYNSPSVLLASVCMFLWARTWKISSVKINWIASSVLAVYLVEGIPTLNHNIHNIFHSISLSNISEFYSFVVMMIVFFVFYALCILLDKVRIIITSPLNSLLIYFLNKVKIKNRIKLWQNLSS